MCLLDFRLYNLRKMCVLTLWFMPCTFSSNSWRMIRQSWIKLSETSKLLHWLVQLFITLLTGCSIIVQQLGKTNAFAEMHSKRTAHSDITLLSCWTGESSDTVALYGWPTLGAKQVLQCAWGSRADLVMQHVGGVGLRGGMRKVPRMMPWSGPRWLENGLRVQAEGARGFWAM